MLDYLQRLLGGKGLAPHGYCLFWDPALLWTHAISDALIGIAYFSIPVAMAAFLMRRPDVRYRNVAWLFVLFILACGTTHFLSIWTLWVPDYGIEALVKMVTAAASVATAVALWPLLPRAIALPSPAQLERVNQDLLLRIGERDAALAALERADQDRRATANILHQAQKMDALGQLTGGIAHDFNNLLTVVTANLERARRLAGSDAAVTDALEQARAGADRAAALTGQLLSFARRQPLNPEPHDLNALVTGLQPLLERAIDKNLTLDFQLRTGLPKVRLDRTQAESALLNLVINARDATPEGGCIAISTQPQPDGRVLLEVRDTGSGMTPEVKERVFEPFFTTKGAGRGTGLGLSQVYGFIGQIGGEVDIESTPGIGTAIRILLPPAA